MIVVGPDFIMALYEGKKLPSLQIGKLVYERTGVPKRRGYLAHNFTEEQLKDLKKELEKNKHLKRVSFVETVPNSWRFP